MPRSLLIVMFPLLFPIPLVAAQPAAVPGADSSSPGAPPEWHLWIGPAVGYSGVLMTDPNNILREREADLRRLGGPSAELIGGGMVFGGQVTASYGRVLLGLDVSWMSATGTYEMIYNTQRVREEFSTDLWSVLASVGYRAVLKPDYRLDLLLSGGYGIGSVRYARDSVDAPVPSSAISFRGDFDGGGVVIMPQMILRIPLGAVSLDFRGGYRWADLGEIAGPVRVNGEDRGEQHLGFEGRKVEYDFSGVVASGGLSVRIF